MTNTGVTKGYGPGTDVSFEAENAMATNYLPVGFGTAQNEVDIIAANTTKVIGFTQIEQPTAGSMVTVRIAGFSLATCSGGWTKGDHLTATTAGVLETTTTAADLICGIAMETVDDGDLGEILIVSPSIRYDSF